MFVTLLKSKLHRVRVTCADLHYEGSCSIDTNLMKAARLSAHEHIHVWNITRGTRFETYVIPAPKGSGMVQMNGAAAHRAKKGDLVIVTSFGLVAEKELKNYKPVIVFVDKNNRVKDITYKSGRPEKLPVR